MWIHAGVNGNELDQSIYIRTTTIQRHERNVTRRERDEENELESISIVFWLSRIFMLWSSRFLFLLCEEHHFFDQTMRLDAVGASTRCALHDCSDLRMPIQRLSSTPDN